jgi:hypothetical protein
VQDNLLFDYLNNLSHLKIEKHIEATQTLNSLGMDHSLLTSPEEAVTNPNDPISAMNAVPELNLPVLPVPDLNLTRVKKELMKIASSKHLQ